MPNKKRSNAGLKLLVPGFILVFVSLYLPSDYGPLVFMIATLLIIVGIIMMIVRAIRSRRDTQKRGAIPETPADALPQQSAPEPVSASAPESGPPTAPNAFAIGSDQNFVRLSTAEFIRAQSTSGYVALDFETTGLNPKSDRITEIGVIKISPTGDIVGRYSALVNPCMPIPPIVAARTGITDQMVMSSPAIQTVLPDLLNFIGHLPFIAYNASFDKSFLENELKRADIGCSISYADALAWARETYSLAAYKQGDVASYIGCPPTVEHRALADCETLVNIVSDMLANECTRTTQTDKLDEPAVSSINSYETYLALVQQIIDNAKSKNVDLSDIFFGFHGNPQNPVIWRKNGLDRIVEALGGVFRDNISGKLDYYVCFDDEVTGTVMKARGIEQDPRYHLHIIDTETFFRIIGYGTDEPDHDGPAEIRKRKQLEREAKEAAIREKEAARAQKDALRAEHKAQIVEKKPRRPKGHAVRQLDSNGNIVNEYPTIAIAAATVGTNAKSIRDVLIGKQKRAGGYCWETIDTDEESNSDRNREMPSHE